MAARLACDLSSQIAAAAPIAGGYRSLPACHPAQPVSVLEMHGTADTTVPYHGDGDDHAGAALAYAFGWAERDGCRPKPLKTHYAPHTIRYLWQGCAGGSVVEQLSLYDVGHGLPEAPAADIRAPGPQTIAGAQTAWSFLSAISRSPAL
jgi:polyhydroxybutyrate depolymerase